MNKVLKNVINNTIEREYQNIMEDYQDHLKREPELKQTDDEYSKRLERLMQELYKLLPKEHHHIIGEFEDAAVAIMCVESRLAFKKGVLLGLTELSYLGEVGSEIAYI